jgi:hypothetical protein
MNKPSFTSAEKEIAEMLRFYLSAARAQPPTRAGGPDELEKQASKLPEALPNPSAGATT